jgi:hypothetical protein
MTNDRWSIATAVFRKEEYADTKKEYFCKLVAILPPQHPASFRRVIKKELDYEIFRFFSDK